MDRNIFDVGHDVAPIYSVSLFPFKLFTTFVFYEIFKELIHFSISVLREQYCQKNIAIVKFQIYGCGHLIFKKTSFFSVRQSDLFFTL